MNDLQDIIDDDGQKPNPSLTTVMRRGEQFMRNLRITAADLRPAGRGQLLQFAIAERVKNWSYEHPSVQFVCHFTAEDKVRSSFTV